MSRRRRWLTDREWERLRVVLLFFGGMAGVAYETVVENADRPTLLFMFGAMMCLGPFLPTSGGS